MTEMKYELLNKVNSPADLKEMTIEQLTKLAAELRHFIICNVDKTGGHLGSSLGVIELTIALHKVFDLPKDKIVWDVGHQGYAHKILTGRRDRFHTNRQFGGISGFIKPSESPYDAFGVGHASTSISAGFGFVCARDVLKENYNVISVIGDGSMSGGLAYEGLNNAGASQKKFLVILNDNEMAISKNVGAMSKYLTNILTLPTFNKVKDEVWNLTGRNELGKTIRRAITKIDRSWKALLTPGQLFERLGFNYMGPINGHDTENLIKVLEQIKNDVSGPVLLHLLTEKGKGFKPAEDGALDCCHGVGPGVLDEISTTVKEPQIAVPKYQDVFGSALCEFAAKDSKIVAITAAMKGGTGLDEFAEKFPDRFFDVGIAEEHALTFASALAMQGVKPVVAIYSSFMQRALDQLIHDAVLQHVHLVLMLDRAGLVGEDGPTHHGVFDLSYLRYIPEVTLAAPGNEKELKDMLHTALSGKGVHIIRYPRGSGSGISFADNAQLLPIGRGEKLVSGKKIAVLAIGKMVNYAQKAVEILKTDGKEVSLYNMRYVKPLDADLIAMAAAEHEQIVTVEDNAIQGGFGSAVLEELQRQGKHNVKVTMLGIPDHFVEHGAVNILYKNLKLDGPGLAETIARLYFSNSN